MHVRIGRRANHDKAGIGTAGDGDHILRHRFGQPNAGIETFRNDIDGTTLQGQCDVHVGMQHCAISRIRSCHFMPVVVGLLGIVRSWLVSQPPGFLIIVVASLGTQ
jgi:hypothetical protein